MVMQTKESLTANIQQRVQEVEAYQVNIDNYTVMLTLIPGPWTLRPEQRLHKDTPVVELVHILPDNDVQAISDAQFFVQISKMLLVERLEQRKTQFVLDAMKLQLKDL